VNARHPHHLRHLTRTWLFALVAILAMVGSTIQPSTAQVSSPTASQFFEAVDSGTLMTSASGATVLHTPLGSFTGPSGPAEFGNALGQSFSFIEFTTDSVETGGNLVIARFTMTGVHTGWFHGMSASCAGISVQGVAIMQTGFRMEQTENLDSGTLGQHTDPAYSVQMVVTQQWISFDVDQIESQIERYRSVVPNGSGQCFNWNPNVRFADSGSPALPPATDEPVQWGNAY
jgi:hypothetical protein